MWKKTICLLLLTLCLAGNALAADKNPTAVIETNLGKITVELFQNKAPVSVKNFLNYASSGFYSGTIFHRVIAGFMIQGGGLTKEIVPKGTKAPIKNEAANGLTNDRGTLAMARTGAVDSATSQFFINVVNNDFLNHRSNDPGEYGYAVFGKVISGMDVVDKIAATPTGRVHGMPNVPLQPVVIEKVTIQK